jgi:hypothetical protein
MSGHHDAKRGRRIDGQHQVSMQVKLDLITEICGVFPDNRLDTLFIT